MNDPMTIEAPLKTDADYEAAIDRYLAALDEMRRDTQENRRRIDRLHEQNEAKLQSILKMLNLR